MILHCSRTHNILFLSCCLVCCLAIGSCLKDTGTYEMRQMVYLGFRVVLDGKKS